MCVMVLLYSSQYISSTYHIFPGLQIFLSEIESFWHVIESFPHEALVNFYCYLLLKHFESIVEKMAWLSQGVAGGRYLISNKLLGNS